MNKSNILVCSGVNQQVLIFDKQLVLHLGQDVTLIIQWKISFS